MHVLVTGGAGFIGSHLCDRLVQRGDKVWCVDNLYLGQRRNIAHLEANPAFRFIEGDVLDRPVLEALFADGRFEAVFHLAANSDIAAGNADAELDLRLNQLTTLEVLEAMRRHGVKRLFFASTSAIFGEASGDLHEDFGPLQPISFYGASKLGAEGYTSVYANQHAIRTVILRFPNVIGERSTHGVIFDFLRKLKANPNELEVLGDGNQQKPYLYVGDLVDAILVAWDKADAPFSVFHASGIDSTSVREIAEIVVAAAGRPDTRLRFTGGDRGWPGDVPKFSYDISRLKALGWQPRRHSTDAVRFAVERILANGF
ncbi:MAG: NAD-dependent epimerase/dehydratase family protein [Xanthobacteraceae bacterium]|nr:NAD-dependent epimerase/dehydratase family protein [Xanthobacteraceae bacterium]